MSYKNEVIDVEDLCLDQKNYRIDFDRYNTIEEEVDRLYEDEDIIGMIKEIVDFKGLHPNDIPIVIPKDDSKYTVVEGNRRLLAVKSLLGLINPPAKYKDQVDELKSKLSNEKLNSLSKMWVVVYDLEDKDYMKIIASKHSAISYERWGQISQWHFFKDVFDSNHGNIDSASTELGRKKSDVIAYIHYHNLLSYIRSLKYWDDEGLRDKIEKNKLEPTKFARPLGFKSVINELNIEFLDNLDLKIPENGKDEFDYILFKYAEASLINDKTDNEYISTRSSTSHIINLIKKWKDEYQNLNSHPGENTEEGKENEDKDTNKDTDSKEILGDTQSKDEEGKTTLKNIPENRKPDDYFSDLKCTINDDRLSRLTIELSKISIKQFPIATIMLARSLLESALTYQIIKKGLKDDYNAFKGNNGLDKRIKFSIDRKIDLFTDPKSVNGLDYLKKYNYKTFMDDIVHNRWVFPTEKDIAQIAGEIKELLKDILTDNA